MKYNKILLLLPLLISCNSNTNQIINEKKVKNYRLNYNVTYTGMLKNGNPDGEGTFKYRNNDTLTTFIVKLTTLKIQRIRLCLVRISLLEKSL